MIDFSPTEIEHYQRHLSLSGFGESAQKKLKEAKVLVVGAGGLGSPALKYLVAAGVGRVGIVDDDRVEKSNLQRQILFDCKDVGKSKAKVALSKLSEMNPHVKFESFPVRIDTNNIESIFHSYSIVLDGSDNFATRFLINDACVLFDKILIHGSIFEFTGQVSVFNFLGGPTYRCLFGEPPKDRALSPCSEVGVLGVLPGLIGTMMATETIKVITGIGDVLSGKLWLYDALSQQSRIVKFERNLRFSEVKNLSVINSNCPLIKRENFTISEISPSQMKSMLKANNSHWVLDVREKWEREIQCIEPSTHIPLGKFSDPGRIKLPKEISKNSSIIIYCKAGVRSRTACEVLFSLGYKNLFNLSGGMIEWEKDNT